MNRNCKHDFEILEKFVFDDELTSAFLYCRKCLAICEISLEVINHKRGEYDVREMLLDDLDVTLASKNKCKEGGA